MQTLKVYKLATAQMVEILFQVRLKEDEIPFHVMYLYLLSYSQIDCTRWFRYILNCVFNEHNNFLLYLQKTYCINNKNFC